MRAPALLAVLVISTSAFAQTTWYVDASAIPPGAGSSADPYASVQHAIAASTTLDGDTIVVASGIYFESIDFLGKAVHVRGPASGATAVIDAQGAGCAARFTSGEGPASILEGVTLRHGTGLGTAPFLDGGGLHVRGASPTCLRLVVTANSAARGGGVYVENGSPQFIDCDVIDNRASTGPGINFSLGAGAFVACDASPIWTGTSFIGNGWQGGDAFVRGGGLCGGGTYVDCSFVANQAFAGAGAYANECVGLYFSGCRFEENRTTSPSGWCFPGGGLWGPALVEDSLFVRNESCRQGGGVLRGTLVRCALIENVCWGAGAVGASGGGACAADLTDCRVLHNASLSEFVSSVGGGITGGTALRTRIEGNLVTGWGGGAFGAALFECVVVANEARGSPWLSFFGSGGGIHQGSAVRTVIAGNRAPFAAGAEEADLERCTVVGNDRGGVLARISERVSSSIVRGNVGYQILPIAGTADVTYSNVEGGAAGAGNFDADPLFFAPVARDFHLKAGSPCIDAGDPALVDADGTRADAGAFAFDPNWCGAPSTVCAGKRNSLGCTPAIEIHGAPVLSGPDDFSIRAGAFVNGHLGRMLWSRRSASEPFQGGTLCVGAPIVGAPISHTGGSGAPGTNCGGSLSFAFTHAWLVGAGLSPGDTAYAQFVARDPLQPDGTGWSLSNAVEFTVCP